MSSNLVKLVIRMSVGLLLLPVFAFAEPKAQQMPWKSAQEMAQAAVHAERIVCPPSRGVIVLALVDPAGNVWKMWIENESLRFVAIETDGTSPVREWRGSLNPDTTKGLFVNASHRPPSPTAACDDLSTDTLVY